MNDVDLLHRLTKDLDSLKREGILVDGDLERRFVEVARPRLRKGYRQKHEDALKTFAESHGLPLSLEEYESWLKLLNEQDDEYRDVYTYRRLKELHQNGNLFHFEEALNDNSDAILRTRRDQLIDGFLACSETRLYEVSENNRAVDSDNLERMRSWIGNLTQLVAVWNTRVNILEAYCREDLEGLADAVQAVIVDRNLEAGWVNFRHRDTQRLAQGIAERFIARILNRLSDLERTLNNPNQQPSPDDLARALEYALLAYNIAGDGRNGVNVAIGVAEKQMIMRILGRCLGAEQLTNIRRYLTAKRDEYLPELATRPVKEMLSKFEELDRQVGRLHRALSNYKKHPDQSANINPIFFKELAEGNPQEGLNKGVRNITEKLRILTRGIEELKAQYTKLLSAHDDAILGRQTWQLPNLSTEAQTADAELDRIAGQDVNYEVGLFQQLGTQLKEHLRKIREAMERLAGDLDPKRRQTEEPLSLYRGAESALNAIETEAETIRNLPGYERIIDLSIFKVPDSFIRSAPNVVLDRNYAHLVGFEEHRRVVTQLIERAQKWKRWHADLTRVYAAAFKHRDEIDAWQKYTENLCNHLPYGVSIAQLNDGLYGTTREWLTKIEAVNDRPLISVRGLRDALSSSNTEQLFNLFESNALPALAVPSDLVDWFIRETEGKLGITLNREIGNIVEDLRRKLEERAEEFEANRAKVEAYLRDSIRIRSYVEDALEEAERQLQRARHDARRGIQEAIAQYKQWLAALDGDQPPNANAQ